MLASWKKHIALLLMLVYTSQSLAAWLTPCHMDEVSSEPKSIVAVASAHESAHDMHHNMGHDHAAMNHSMLHPEIAPDSIPDTTAAANINVDKADCCDTLGHCLMGGCVVIHAASGTSALSPGDGLSIADLYELPQPLLVTSSHFRPPIFG